MNNPELISKLSYNLSLKALVDVMKEFNEIKQCFHNNTVVDNVTPEIKDKYTKLIEVISAQTPNEKKSVNDYLEYLDTLDDVAYSCEVLTTLIYLESEIIYNIGLIQETYFPKK